MIKLLLVTLTLFSSYAFSCEVTNLTDQAQANSRNALFNNMDNPGVRLAWSGMKEMNKQFGLGGVNSVISGHEKSLCESFSKGAFSRNNPEVKVQIYKTDFKGYYISCTPQPGCTSTVSGHLKTIEPPTFPGTNTKFQTIHADAANYQEGYVKTRVIAEYQNYRPPLHKFVKEEMDQAIKIAKEAHPGMSEKQFMELMSKNADLYRSSGIDSVDPSFKRLVMGLDNLLETPFAGSNDIDKELLRALTEDLDPNRAGYQVSSAVTGDDLFLVIKENGEVKKVIGADARGLGVTNMTTRYTEYMEQMSKHGGINGMKDVFGLSMRAIKRADYQMDTSLNQYADLVKAELANIGDRDLDEVIGTAHGKYYQQISDNPELMQIRSGAIEACQKTSKDCVMNRITTVHNRLKILEKAGIDGHYGASCLAVEYALLKNGLK
jgi:hypothetical protein